MISVRPSEQELQQWRTNWCLAHDRYRNISNYWSCEMLADLLAEHTQAVERDENAAKTLDEVFPDFDYSMSKQIEATRIDMSGSCPDCDYDMPAPIGAKEPTRAEVIAAILDAMGKYGQLSARRHLEELAMTGTSVEKVAYNDYLPPLKSRVGVPLPDKNPKFGGGCDL